MLAERYRNQGFEITRFGAASTALRRFDKVIYVFNHGTVEDQRFIDALCDCHLKIVRRKYACPEVLHLSSFALAGSAA